MKLIVGLGNPGKEYQNTRHNAGFMSIDKICDKLNVSLDKTKFNAEYYQGVIKGQRVLLVKPLTYMNLSGQAVIQFVDYFDIDIEDILVIFDDMDTEVGSIRIKQKGSDGRQNGMKNILSHLKTNEVPRIRIGIGRNRQIETSKYVLSKFSKDEQIELEHALDKASDAAIYFIENDILQVMNDFNGKE
ncbi:MAG: aminoacyl-tRNA hydrolase [Erysipelotrichales bacterium]